MINSERAKASPVVEDWRSRGAYSGSKHWKNKRWAWEFLRRNPRYQRLCRSNSPTLHLAEFGLSRFKDWTEPFLEAESIWAVENIRVVLPSSRRRGPPTEPIGDTQVALVFDFEWVNQMGQNGAIDAFLANCREALETEIRKVVRSDPYHYDREWEPGRGEENKLVWEERLDVKGPNKSYLEDYLLICDADANNAGDRAILNALFDVSEDRSLDASIYSLLKDSTAKLEKLRTAAYEIVRWKYLELLPRQFRRVRIDQDFSDA